MMLKFFFALVITLSFHASVADIRLSDGKESAPRDPLTPGEFAPIEPAMRAYARQLATVPPDSERVFFVKDLPFILFFGEKKYYIQPVMFMAKDRPNEVCTPERFTGAPTYKCAEGQREKYSCHLFFFNSSYQPVGAYRIQINEPVDVFCNAMPAMGVYDKTRNELLVTYQYFPIDQKAASKISELGSGWIRATSLFRLKEKDGKILVEQDDSCLKNPNRYETIPDARKALKACVAQQR